MCRNIRVLFNFEPPANDEEIRASALQYVRKVSGMRDPSRDNREAFDEAVETVSRVTAELLGRLSTRATPRNREQERRKARQRWQQRAERIARTSGGAPS